jgi:hypothetical protein
MEEMLYDPAGAINRMTRKVLPRDLHLLIQHMFHNEYWNRAWVVQEIVLAHKVVVSLDIQTYTLSDFGRRVHLFNVELRDTPFEQFDIRESQSLRDSIRNTSLLSLLRRFRNKHCVIPQDRILSLLSTCHEDDKIEVDYDMHWRDLVARVLKNSRHESCVCVVALVAKSFSTSGCFLTNDLQTNRVVIAFDATNLGINRHGHLRLWKTPSSQLKDCPLHLMGALRHMFWITSLPEFLRKPDAQDEVFDLPTALREFMDLGEYKHFWQHYPKDTSYRWCSFKSGWSIGVDDEFLNICTVRISISLSTPLIILPPPTSCGFSSSRYIGDYIPFTGFRIEQVPVDEDRFLPGARFGYEL